MIWIVLRRNGDYGGGLGDVLMILIYFSRFGCYVQLSLVLPLLLMLVLLLLLLLLFRHSAKNLNAQEDRLATSP